MIKQFSIPAELQQFLQAVGSKALTNVTWNLSFEGNAPVLPFSPAAVRRSIMFDKSSFSDGATPLIEYKTFIQNVDGSGTMETDIADGTTKYDSWRPIPGPGNVRMLSCLTPRTQHDSYTGMTNITLWTSLPDGTDQELQLDTPSSYSWVSYEHPEFSPNGEEVVIAVETSTQYSIVLISGVQ